MKIKIKDYLDILEKLPQTPFQKERVEMSYYVDNKNIIESKNISYGRLEFVQIPYKDHMNRIRYRWKEVEEPNIDYKVNDIYIKSTNDLIFASLIDLTHTYKFKNLATMTSNIKSCYINFREKMWSLYDNKYDKFYYIDDDLIIERIFIASLNEYPNGIPIIWEDL